MNTASRQGWAVLILVGGMAVGYALSFSRYMLSDPTPLLQTIGALFPFLLAALTGIAKNTTV